MIIIVSIIMAKSLYLQTFLRIDMGNTITKFFMKSYLIRVKVNERNKTYCYNALSAIAQRYNSDKGWLESEVEE
jgi:hypothetical protein